MDLVTVSYSYILMTVIVFSLRPVCESVAVTLDERPGDFSTGMSSPRVQDSTSTDPLVVLEHDREGMPHISTRTLTDGSTPDVKGRVVPPSTSVHSSRVDTLHSFRSTPTDDHVVVHNRID